MKNKKFWVDFKFPYHYADEKKSKKIYDEEELRKGTQNFELWETSVWPTIHIKQNSIPFSSSDFSELTLFLDGFLAILKNNKELVIGDPPTQGGKSYFKNSGNDNFEIWYETNWGEFNDVGGHIAKVNGVYKDLTEQEWFEKKNKLEQKFIVKKRDVAEGFIDYINRLTKKLVGIRPEFRNLKQYKKLLEQKKELEKILEGEYK